jgi:hypothetical protein
MATAAREKFSSQASLEVLIALRQIAEAAASLDLVRTRNSSYKKIAFRKTTNTVTVQP